ncbi:MAG: hypothetical protein CMQ61_07930 [Gammaproteobacteria bacterium]|nr:hypothetical protein [Gammaproteobacteria bacterium]|tara:strand:+ start:4290 stop:4673 length:384 start_codon:yes stop_codon:yes gene_type:complete
MSHSIIGMWTLVSTRAWTDEEHPLPPPFGPLPRGVVVFYENSRMMCVLTDGRDHLDAAREYSSYTGIYTFDGTVLTTHVDQSVNQERIGGDQVRGVRFEDGYMLLTPPSRPHPSGTEHRELKWQRVS